MENIKMNKKNKSLLWIIFFSILIILNIDGLIKTINNECIPTWGIGLICFIGGFMFLIQFIFLLCEISEFRTLVKYGDY